MTLRARRILSFLLCFLPWLLVTTPGLSAPLRERVDAVLRRAVEEERLVGAVVLVARHGRVVHAGAWGWSDREARRAMRPDAVFRLASLSKPVTSAVVLALAERGALSLEDPVTRWLPWFAPELPGGGGAVITVGQLLTHTAGLTYGFLQPPGGTYARAGVSDGLDRPGITLEENLRRLASVPLAGAPGGAWSYSLAVDVLGAVAEQAGGAPLPELTARLVTGPLNMLDTGFLVSDPERLAVPYVREGGVLRRMDDPQVVAFGASGARFAPSRITDPGAYPSGGAGMCGTASDYLAFLEVVRAGGAALGTKAARSMTQNRLEPGQGGPGPGWGFGYGAAVLLDPAAAGSPSARGTWRWSGAYGAFFLVDRASGLSLVVLTNTTPDGMDGEFPWELVRAVYGR
ncbi:Esterase EstB [Fundidesulfovibrio magnetotacticus]|uniref:Esterase EstB n=1 Tax=Fundidesulfovibrio magnetotacticus TaxID=2730080 RepID=A0A6V8LU36_9BACT|nr:serine hydrolase domain-containing protein [Fundidesulfovibrio magnetotacticus]GFK93619.1 Esterase EstB [Fundidesulfovibrio magnetotacticus]